MRSPPVKKSKDCDVRAFRIASSEVPKAIPTESSYFGHLNPDI
jgi:hypothetical protein